MGSLRRFMTTTAPASVILIRIVVGAVFLSEGIRKFLFPNELGIGRFIKIGIPAPEVMGAFVGLVEIICGSLIIFGLLTRLAAIPLIVDMCIALISTKLPILLGHGFWRFSLSKLSSYGFWSMAHEATVGIFLPAFVFVAASGLLVHAFGALQPPERFSTASTQPRWR